MFVDFISVNLFALVRLQVAADNADDDEARLAFSQLRTDLAEIRTRHMSFLRVNHYFVVDHPQ